MADQDLKKPGDVPVEAADTADTLGEKVGDFFHNVGEGIGNAFEQIKETVVGEVPDDTGAGTKMTDEVASSATTTAEKTVEETKDTATGMADTVTTSAEEKADELVGN